MDSKWNTLCKKRNKGAGERMIRTTTMECQTIPTSGIRDRDLISFSERKKHKRHGNIKYSAIGADARVDIINLMSPELRIKMLFIKNKILRQPSEG